MGYYDPPEYPDPSPESQEIYEILETAFGNYDEMRQALLSYPEWTGDGSHTQYGTDECEHCEAIRQEGHAEDCPRLLGEALAPGFVADIIQRVCEIIDNLAAEASRECPECERRGVEAERAAEKEAEEHFATLPPSPTVCGSVCLHGLNVTDCNPCLIASDLAYDAARERRMLGR